MLCSDRFWKGIIPSLGFILLHYYIVSDAQRYDKCITQDGRQGVCVVKRYCREATSHPLLPCEGPKGEEDYCCPIQPTQRSAPPPRTQEQSLDSDRPPRTDQDRRRSETSSSSSRPRNKERPRIEQDDPNWPRREQSREPERPQNKNRPKTVDERDRSGFEDTRVSEKPPDHYRPRFEPDDRDRRRTTFPRDIPERDDRLNKTPPPADRRSPSRYPDERPLPPKRDPPRDVYEDDRRIRPPLEDRPRQRDDDTRPSSSRTASNDRQDIPVRRPDNDRYYPNRDELDVHRNTQPPRRPNRNNGSSDLSRVPIRFPDTYESPVPRPKVPACGVKPYELFIAGGSESRDHEWPWMTAIFRRYPDSRPKTFLCGGSLINTKYVLTAAHCFVNNYVVLPASAFVVRLGSHFLDTGEEYTVSDVVIHHNHSGSDFFNDIALIRLASEVYITDKIAPICLPYPEMMRDSLVGRRATVAGWGDTSFRASNARILQHVTVPIVSGEECFAAYSRVRGAAFLARGSDHVICAGLREGGKDACLGDSGGPLMLSMDDDRWVVIGIVSLGYKCAEPGYPGVYTRVTHYISWINANMKKH